MINKKKEKLNLKKYFLKIKNNYLLVVIFVLSLLSNDLILRLITVRNGLSISPLLIDIAYLIILSLFSLLFKKENRIKYFIIVSIILDVVCVINSIYYHYYSSFASISLLQTLSLLQELVMQ